MKGLCENNMSKETTMNHPMKFTLLTLTWNRSEFVASAHSAEVILLPGGRVCVCRGGQGNGKMICWLSSPVILEDSIPQGVPLSSESHFQLWLCVTLNLQGCNTNQPWLALWALGMRMCCFPICFDSTIHSLPSPMTQTPLGCISVTSFCKLWEM